MEHCYLILLHNYLLLQQKRYTCALSSISLDRIIVNLSPDFPLAILTSFKKSFPATVLVRTLVVVITGSTVLKSSFISISVDKTNTKTGEDNHANPKKNYHHDYCCFKLGH